MNLYETDAWRIMQQSDCPRSSKVIDFGTNQSACTEVNSNTDSILHRFGDMAA